ncbi:hypothetical protein [Parvularcula marina]|uniref:hypothetical protein n=1 Tax=Parvularcula marina TaxID=2292771 RepID=UPI003511241F
MIRLTLISSVALLAACASNDDNTISSMNYLQAPIEAACARDALIDEEGFAAVTSIRQIGGAEQIDATFNQDMPVTVIVRRQDDGTGEVSVFTRLEEGATPLERRKANFAVTTADETIYRQCTADGKINPGDADVIIEAQE